MNKLIINQDVLLRTPIIQDAVRGYREIYKEKRNKLFKQSSACSSSGKHLLPQPKNMALICTDQYRLVKDKNITVSKIKNKRLLKCKSF
jgi:hypothetical protein